MPALQGTLDLIVLRMLQTMGHQHTYAIATRLQQETLRWHRMADLLDKFLSEGA